MHNPAWMYYSEQQLLILLALFRALLLILHKGTSTEKHSAVLDPELGWSFLPVKRAALIIKTHERGLCFAVGAQEHRV